MIFVFLPILGCMVIGLVYQAFGIDCVLKIANKMSLTAQHILNLDLLNLDKLKLNGKYINQCSK